MLYYSSLKNEIAAVPKQSFCCPRTQTLLNVGQMRKAAIGSRVRTLPFTLNYFGSLEVEHRASFMSRCPPLSCISSSPRAQFKASEFFIPLYVDVCMHSKCMLLLLRNNKSTYYSDYQIPLFTCLLAMNRYMCSTLLRLHQLVGFYSYILLHNLIVLLLLI